MARTSSNGVTKGFLKLVALSLALPLAKRRDPRTEFMAGGPCGFKLIASDCCEPNAIDMLAACSEDIEQLADRGIRTYTRGAR